MNLKQRTGKCTEELFWDCVAELSWPCDYHKAERAILMAWGVEFAKSFSAILSEKRSVVCRAFEACERVFEPDVRDTYYLSDDGMSDFSAHVVGMGQAVFESEVSNPKKLLERAQKRGYKENFGYCIPYATNTTSSFEEWCKAMGYHATEAAFESDRFHDDENTFEIYIDNIREAYQDALKGDWRKIESEAYVARTSEYHSDISAFIGQLQPSTEAEQGALELACVASKYLQHLMAEQTDEALELSEDAMRAWWGLYHIERDLGELRGRDGDLLPTHHPHGMENLINDHRIYMGGLDRFSCEYHLRELREKAA